MSHPEAAAGDPRPLLIGKETSHPYCPLCPISMWDPGTWTQGLNPGLPHVNSESDSVRLAS